MSVGLLLITHEKIATSLLHTTQQMFNSSPLTSYALEIPLDAPVDEMFTLAKEHMCKLDNGDGVLILTDIYGSTPSNIGKRLCADFHCKLVAGLNLPMLIRILNYPQLNLDSITLKAVSGAHDGILLCECQDK